MRVKSYTQEAIELATGQRTTQTQDFTELQARQVNTVLDDGLRREKALELINKWNNYYREGAPIRWIYTIT